jgi:hypothetical protein
LAANGAAPEDLAQALPAAPRHQSPFAAAVVLIVLGVLFAGTIAAMRPYRDRR